MSTRLSIYANLPFEPEKPMKIHHFTVPAADPARVASVLAELLGACAVPLPHSSGSFIVHDGAGTAIEVWPASLRAGSGDHGSYTVHCLCRSPGHTTPISPAKPAMREPSCLSLNAKAGARRSCTTVRRAKGSALCVAGSKTAGPSNWVAARCAGSMNSSLREPAPPLPPVCRHEEGMEGHLHHAGLCRAAGSGGRGGC